MKSMTKILVPAALVLFAQIAPAQTLDLEQLLGTWNMSYDMGQGQETGTITVSRNEDGSARISMSTTGGGDSEAHDIEIDGDELRFSRDVSAQGQGLGVDYTAKLVDGKLEGSFEIDLSALGGAAGGLGAPTAWTATRAE